MAKTKEKQATLTWTTPSSAGTTVAGVFNYGWLVKGDILTVDAKLTGATGGTLDITLQRQTVLDGVPQDEWLEWARFTQIAAGAAATSVTFGCDGSGTLTIQTVGRSTTASPGTPVMTANTYTNVMPNGPLRVVVIAGAGTSAGASQTITITAATEIF